MPERRRHRVVIVCAACAAALLVVAFRLGIGGPRADDRLERDRTAEPPRETAAADLSTPLVADARKEASAAPAGEVSAPDAATHDPVEHAFWPEFKVNVRDVHTLAHLADVELHVAQITTAAWGRNNVTKHLLGEDLSSPIELLAGRDPATERVTVAGVALSPGPDDSPRLVDLTYPFAPEHGVVFTARAPGYAWGSVTVDVQESGEHDLLLNPGTTLGVRVANAQPALYAALETEAMLGLYRLHANGNVNWLRFEPVDETLATEGMRFESLEPGDYAVAVELGGGPWAKRPVLGREELTLAPGDSREIVLALAAPPAPPARATLGGVISFPAFGGEDGVRLEFYEAAKRDFVGDDARYQPRPDLALTLADLDRVGGTLPTWSFEVDLPVGLHQVELWPFLKSWMIKVPEGGRDDVALVIPELAEVIVETVDASTNERIPIDQLFYRHEEDLPRRVHIDRNQAEVDEPGLLRFWSAPGPALIYHLDSSNDLIYGRRYEDLELIGGLQTVRLELEPVYAFHLDLRVDGTTLERFDGAWGEAYSAVRDRLRAVGHEGELATLRGVGVNREILVVEVTTPGIYEVRFDGIAADRFHESPPRLVDVRPGEPVRVIVDLQTK